MSFARIGRFLRRRKAAVVAAVCVLALAAGVTITALGQDGDRVYSNDIFVTRGFKSQYSATIADGTPKGLLLTGKAPASFSLRNGGAGDFDMSFAQLAKAVTFSFSDGRETVTAVVRRDGGNVRVSVNGAAEVSLVSPETSKLSVRLFADESTLRVSAEGGDVSVPVENFSFSDYSVTVSADAGTGEQKLCVYSVDGASLSGPVLRGGDEILYFPVTHDGVVNMPFELPAPTLYTVSGGASNNVNISVHRGDNYIVKSQAYKDGLRFTPTEVGDYTVELVANGGAVSKSYKIMVREALGESEVQVKEEFPFARVGKGSVVSLPRVQFGNDLYKYRWQDSQYTVSLNGERIGAAGGVERGVMYTFSEPGTYRFDYYSAEPYIKNTYSFTVEVVEDLPAINFQRNDADRTVGDAFKLPEATLTRDGKPLKMTTVLTFPSGKAITNDTTLTEEGVYTLEFRTTKGEVYSAYSYNFTVSESLHGESVAKYGSYSEGYFDTPVNGLLIELDNGKTYEFGNIVDLSDNAWPNPDFMDFYALPYNAGSADFSGLEITLTDAYDPDIYVIINFVNSTDGRGQCYVRARASNQTELIGLEWTNSTTPKIHRNNIYGYIGRLSVTGVDNIDYPGGFENTDFHLGFDNSTQIIYGTHGWNSNNSFGDNNRVVTRLADNTLYKEVFGGFTTGEVRVSIAGTNYNSSKGRLLIKDLDGQDLTKTTVQDGKGPMIRVKTGDYEEGSLPVAVVGKSYPVFSATANDARSGKAAVTRKVTFQSGSSSFDVNMKDGAFTPDREGVYTLEYYATDYYKNTSKYSLTVRAVKAANLTAALSGKTESAFCGQEVATAAYTISGGSGAPRLKSLAVTGPSGKKVKLTGGKFIPESEGTYKVAYKFTDYIGQEYTTDYTVNVTASKNPVTNSDPVLPLAFLDGGTYTLPMPKAVDYSTGKKREIEPSITVADASGTRAAENGSVTVSGNTGSNATVTYTYKTDNGSLTKKFTIPVRRLSVGEKSAQMFNVAGLVVPTYGRLTTIGDSPNYFFSTSRDDSFFFANTLLADVFTFNFNVGSSRDANDGNVGAVRVVLTDSEDRSKSVVVEIVPNPDDRVTSLFSVNGGTGYVINGTFHRNTNYSFTVGYNGQTKCVNAGDTLTVEVTEYAGGGKFKGFPSGKVYARVETVGVTGNTVMELISVNGQPLTHEDMKDRIAPNITLTKALKVCFDRNASVTLPRALVADVLSINANVQVSLRSPSGKYVKASNGTVLQNAETADYRVKLTEIGTYQLSFTVWDDNGGAASTIVQSLNVLDKKAPVIKASKKSLEATAGESIDVSDLFTVQKDDDKRQPDIHLFAQSSTGRMWAIEDGYVTFDKAGKCKIIAVAYDEAGNEGKTVVNVTVGGAK